MSKKYSFQNVIDKMNEKGYELISKESDYNNVSTKMLYICPKHRNKGIQKITLGHLNQGEGCYYCGRERTIQGHIINLDSIEDKILCESKGFEYLRSGRENGKIGIYFICPNHRELGEQFMQKYNMKRCSFGCIYCTNHYLPIWYIKEKLKEFPNVEILDEIDGKLSTRLRCKCTIHNIESNKTIQEIFKGRGCIECGKEKLSKFHTMSLEEYQNKVSNIKNSIKVLKYSSCSEDATFQCLKCGFIWESSSQSMISFGKQCPNCESYYTGEKKIQTFLDTLGIIYILQYKFPDCKVKRPLRFDFYLPHFNACIEFDGQQHFNQRNGWTNLSQIQKYDNIKTDYCKKHHIKLLRIPYWDFDYIDHILFDFLLKLHAIEEIS